MSTTQIPDIELDGAVRSADWLVGLGETWPALAEYVDEHQELAAAHDAAEKACRDLADRFRGEDQAYDRALEAGEDLPERTPLAEQNELMREANSVRLVARRNLAKFADDVVARLRYEIDDLTAVVSSNQAEAAERVREAVATLRASVDEKVRLDLARGWLNKAAGRHVSLDRFGPPWYQKFPDVGSFAGVPIGHLKVDEVLDRFAK